MTTILIAEDEPEVRNYLGLALNCQGYNVKFAENGREVIEVLSQDSGKVSLLLLDLIMPLMDGIETLKEVRRGWPTLPVITLSGSCSPANVASILKGGALDFLWKPVGHEDLLRAIESALAKRPESSFGQPEAIAVRQSDCCISSEGSWSQRVLTVLDVVGSSDVPVLLRGETGVGKEVLARKLHEQSTRSGRPFLKLNCAALPSELVESELFGYERGAFTGAFKNTPGKFEMANSGTILLDEIGDMDFRLQAKLLQVLQDHEFHRLGAKEPCRVDVRVMAATCADLERAIAEKRFREDLYYRLNIIEIHVPPLRERKDEISGLSEFFLEKHSPKPTSGIPPRLLQVLLEHDWPGNVRELENVIRKYIVFKNVDTIARELKRARNCSSRQIMGASWSAAEEIQIGTSASVSRFEDYADRAATAGRQDVREFGYEPPIGAVGMPAAIPSSESSILAEVDHARKRAEADAILKALNSTMWNRKQAAKLLKIDYKALLYKMKKLGIGEKAATPMEVPA